MKNRFFLIFLLLTLPSFGAESRPFPKGFQEDRFIETAHFILYHEAVYAPVGITGMLEGLHAKLLLDLQDVAPWAAREKIRVFVYADAASYASKTGIPEWAAAFAVPESRQIHCYESPHLQRILSHEMTHLFFTPFFSDSGAVSPAWLNEGIAKMMEWNYGQEEDTALMDHESFSKGSLGLAEIFAFDYHHSSSVPPDFLNLWYQQSVSVTAYLMHRLPRSRFPVFCASLRSGKSADDALREAYGNQVTDVAALERLWRESLGEK